MTVPVEPLGSHVAPASPTTALPEAPGHALDAIAPATGRAGGLGPAHEAQCVEKREWSLAPCDDANVRSAKCALISAQKRPKAPKRPIALSPSPSPARPRARARVWCCTCNPYTSPVVHSGPTGTVGGPPRIRGTVEGPPGRRVPGAGRTTPLHRFMRFSWLGMRRHDFSEEVLVEFSMLRLEFWADFLQAG